MSFTFSVARLRQELAWPVLRANLFAGITVGIVALPLSMALAIASGVAPQHGLYTAIIAGIVTALCGGSRVNISGPTAAFVVILLPITHLYGLGGLVISGLMAGVILVAMGAAKLGRFIEVVPYPVTVGFTSGIAVVIATFQIKDFFGLEIASLEGHYLQNLLGIVRALPTLHFADLFTGAVTLAVLLLWARRKSGIPPQLIGLIVGTGLAWLMSLIFADFHVVTIGSRFQYTIDGVAGSGIPPFAPAFVWPWELPDASGKPVGLSFGLLNTLLGSALAIAMLGALESLLCAVIADGMAGTRHDPNRELIGQGIGNIVAPFFGGVPATAAIARTATNIRAGATSPVSSVVHGVFILVAILLLAKLLAYLPMAALAALLLRVAWNMSEAKHFFRIVRVAPGDDKAILLTCFSMTVLFDMTVAVAVGISLAALLFIRRSIEQAGSTRLKPHEHQRVEGLPDYVAIYDVNGPLFFGAAHKALKSLGDVGKDTRVVILDMPDVTMLDMTAIITLEELTKHMARNRIHVIVNQLSQRMITKLQRAGVAAPGGNVEFSSSLEQALVRASELHVRLRTAMPV